MKIHSHIQQPALVLVAILCGLMTAENFAAAEPTITFEPQDQTNYIGRTTSFTVVATGSGSLSYQWQKFSTGFVDVTNGTDFVLTLVDLQTSDAGDYRCVVTDSTGATNCATAHLYVNAPEKLFISNSAPGMVTLFWMGNMVLVEALDSNHLDCTIWFRVSDSSPVTLPVHPDPRFFRLVALPIDYEDSLARCRLVPVGGGSVRDCDECIRAFFMRPPPFGYNPGIGEAEGIGVELGACLCVKMQTVIAQLADGIQPVLPPP